ncbi:unnamed protein product [Tilletia controversa]|uniref:SIS domain-containing protein n=1 Tax=Tilletia controversa TaxID=13291 RepID=A0A8X7MTN6_9BASI|nr:hypothetical protein CF328_g3625 [Tilletia controversa]KAE8247498.1 hypothetical protein A4X06_0g4405 [Tilletia controversa]CAD6918156.1 unnamed protein product [Tilletia controversa]CAD6955638.1 unnamed protein product [Tilletia controversa]CAD6960589.1 unnamed protein product [Tilletia controversa]
MSGRSSVISSDSSASACSSPSLSPFDASDSSGSRTSSFSGSSCSQFDDLTSLKNDAAHEFGSDEMTTIGKPRFDALNFAAQSLHAQSLAIAHASWRLAHHPFTRVAFADALSLLHDTIMPSTGRPGGKIVWTGVGKSGLIGRKLHATALSLGVPSCFLHPVEALHGDLGCVTPQQDIVIALSYSGGSPELVALLPHLERRGVKTVAMCGRRQEESDLGRASAAWIDCRTTISDDEEIEMEEQDMPVSTADVLPSLTAKKQLQQSESNWSISAKAPRPLLVDHHEASPTRLPAPTSSTTVALAMGDTLLLTLAQMCDLDAVVFGRNHPGGKIGEAIAPTLV